MDAPLYWIVAAVVLLAALAVLGLGLRLLWSRHWLLGWLRGCAGLSLLLAAVILGAAGWDLHRYRALTAESPVATLAFSQLEPQLYRVELVDAAGHEHVFQLHGDLWQLDVRMIKWHPRLAQFGIGPGYRLDRISGRYLTLEQEQLAPRSVHGLQHPVTGLDVWQWVRRYDALSGLIDARYGSASYLPMADGAIFEVTMGATGLVARPENPTARAAVAAW